MEAFPKYICFSFGIHGFTAKSVLTCIFALLFNCFRMYCMFWLSSISKFFGTFFILSCNLHTHQKLCCYPYFTPDLCVWKSLPELRLPGFFRSLLETLICLWSLLHLAFFFHLTLVKLRGKCTKEFWGYVYKPVLLCPDSETRCRDRSAPKTSWVNNSQNRALMI